MKVKLHISRAGNNLFVDGLYGRHGSVHLVPSLQPKDLLVEEGGRAYLSAHIGDDKIFVDILRLRDGGNISHKTIVGSEGTIEFDPWDHV